MAKNIVVFPDGTGQDGGARPEQRIPNIYKMYRISRDHAGTDIGMTALTAPVRFVQKLLGSVKVGEISSFHLESCRQARQPLRVKGCRP
jgi:hypothetical protein